MHEKCADPVIRTAAAADAPALRAIYAPYVRDTAVSFEWEVPSEEEFRDRLVRTLARYPYLVAERDGVPVGYAYAGPFQERAAYGWAAELSVYVRQDCRRQGLGRRLYAELERDLGAMGILNLEACVAYPAAPDAHLTDASIRFHEALGFRRVGEFSQCGYKFGRWYDMVWLEKLIGAHRTDQPPVVPFRSVLR